MFKYQHGFCIIRCQPFHIGHDRLIRKMMEECAYGTVLIGSAQESGTEKNPLPYFTRKKMIQNVWRKNEAYNRLRIIGIKRMREHWHNVNYAMYINYEDHSPGMLVAILLVYTELCEYFFALQKTERVN